MTNYRTVACLDVGRQAIGKNLACISMEKKAKAKLFRLEIAAQDFSRYSAFCTLFTLSVITKYWR